MIYRCVNCGGNVIYEPKEGKMKCLSCGGDECQEMIPAQLPDTCVNCGTADSVFTVCISRQMSGLWYISDKRQYGVVSLWTGYYYTV